ncbi:GDSL-type esterase/lipase family protein [Erysipelothrix urinaevulpis]|uniref:GDSL-type esterase/lipase family protein n=1 Tax=Erysipelothrix urinaevulpis TaxID=2683717 RepID=UPI0013583D8E|nr:GDSL-type esterase/lipase family protein [Erysipelothrix urinaevulpis]
MKLNMPYNIDKYQFREGALIKILNIIKKQKETPKNQTLFFGDSLVEHIPNHFPIINNGISGMSSAPLEHLLDELVVKFEPNQVFLHIGTNDLGGTSMVSPREIAWKIVRIMLILQQCLPDAKLYVISTLPCLDELESYQATGKGIRNNDLVDIINKEVQEHLVHTKAQFIDLNSAMKNSDGSIKKEFYVDGLHIKTEAYEYLSKKIKKTSDIL